MRKYAHFIGLKHPFTAQTVAAEFVQVVIWLHGIPTLIILDRDKVFVINFGQSFSNFRALISSTVQLTPQIDCQMEVVNRCLETYV